MVRHLPEALFVALKMHRQKSKFVRPEDFVFSKIDGSLVDPDFLRRNVLYPAMDKAGIDRGLRTHGFHIFRHTGGSIVRAQTGDIKLAQVHLSHARLSTTSDVYVHTNDDDLKKAVEALAGTVQQFPHQLIFSPPHQGRGVDVKKIGTKRQKAAWKRPFEYAREDSNL